MNARVLFLLAFFAVLIITVFLKGPSVSVSTGNAVLPNEANLTTQSFYFYVLLVGFAIMICVILWHFNKVFEKEEKAG